MITEAMSLIDKIQPAESSINTTVEEGDKNPVATGISNEEFFGGSSQRIDELTAQCKLKE